jgi:branched-chain amino acid transport system ATP-binding protein
VSLAVRDLAVSFGGVAALGGVSFAVRPGGITSLIGPNGAGKTTVFNAITGHVMPTHGEVWDDATRLAGLRPCDIAARGIIRTFQKTSVFPRLSVMDNVLIGMHRRGTATLPGILRGSRSVAREEARLGREAAEIVAFVGLEGRSRLRAGALAYGEQRLVELAIALAANPRVLLLDEPAAGMSAHEKSMVMALIQGIREQGITVLLVEHDLRLVMHVSDHVVVLNSGRVIAEGPPSAVQTHPEVIRAYVGAANAGP